MVPEFVLPELPETDWMLWSQQPYSGDYHSYSEGYTDDDMRDYARESIVKYLRDNNLPITKEFD